MSSLLSWLVSEGPFWKALLLAPFAPRARAAPPLHRGEERAEGPLPLLLIEAPVQLGPDTPPQDEADEPDAEKPATLNAVRTPEAAARLFAKHMRETVPGTRFRAADVWVIYRDWCELVEHRAHLQHDNDFLSALAKVPGVSKAQEPMRDANGRRTGERRRFYSFNDPQSSAAGGVCSNPSPEVRAAGRKKRRKGKRRR